MNILVLRPSARKYPACSTPDNPRHGCRQMKRFLSFSRHSFGVRNRSPWRSMFGHALHQFHENDLFTSSAAMSYFGLMALFPASSKFLRDTIEAFSDLGAGAIITCVVLVFWAGSWVFAVIERALNRIW